MLAISTGQATEVSCVILPLRGRQLVLPAACVAEAVLWRDPAPLAGAPGWCAGTFNWHGAVIPALDLERLAASEPASEPERGRCLAVVNRITPDASWPFYALVVHGIPRLVLVAQADVAEESGPTDRGELLHVRVGTERLVIPDLAELERHVAELAAIGS